MAIQPVGGYDDSVEDAPWQDNVNLPGQYGPGGFKRPLGLRPFGLDTTNPPWTGAKGQPPVDLPGQFGPGGFQSNPRMTAPVGPPQGLSLGGDSLTARPATPDDLANMGPQMTSGPRNLRPGMSPAVRNGPGPFTDVTPNGAPAPGSSIWSRLGAWAPSILGMGAPAAVPALAAGGSAAGLWAEPRTPRVDPRISAAGTGGFDVEQPLGDLGGATGAWPQSGPGRSPSGPGIAANPYGAGMPRGNSAATPRPARARPAARVPAAAGPAAVAQQPNLGNYAPIAQPNIARTGNARGGIAAAPDMGAFDFSRLFARQGGS
jgi:hypothetical protein